ncbi:MAG: tetratricopeptide repeat protein [Bacteroidota bacterium]|nr:tetratricopeptide repeat protein [Bacteroidota bacterium]
MKQRILTLLVAVFAFAQVFGQTNQYDTYVPSEYISPNFDMLMRAGATIQARYDQNKKYRDKLIDWVFDLKTKTSERTFLNAMDNYYRQLRAMDGQDFNLLGDKLDIIKQNVKEEIDACNTRMKEAPKLLWESGNNKMKSRDYAGAIRDFSELIELNPTFPYTYRNRGFSYEALGKHSLALADLNKFIDKVQDDAFAYRTRGWIKYYSNDLTGALADFNMQIELDPKSEAYYNRGSAKSQLGDNIGAIADYTKSIELDPTFSMAYNNRGWSKFEMKRYTDAIKDLNKAIELDENNWVAYDSRQETKFAMNDFKGCIEDCNQAIVLNPKSSNSYFVRGRAYFKTGNKTKACEDWSKSGELGKAEAYDFINKYCNGQ